MLHHCLVVLTEGGSLLLCVFPPGIVNNIPKKSRKKLLTLVPLRPRLTIDVVGLGKEPRRSADEDIQLFGMGLHARYGLDTARPGADDDDVVLYPFLLGIFLPSGRVSFQPRFSL